MPYSVLKCPVCEAQLIVASDGKGGRRYWCTRCSYDTGESEDIEEGSEEEGE